MKNNRFNQSYIYELNTRIFCLENGSTMAKLEETLFTTPEFLTADYVWLMGIWQPSPASVEICRRHEGLNHEFRKILPDLSEKDIIGSPYAVYDYEPNPLCAKNWAEIEEFRERLKAFGKKLILDFVPNHMAKDTPLLDRYPECFLRKKEKILCPNSFPHNGSIFYHGRDPYFDGWTDTVQWDFSNPATVDLHLEILSKIAEHCDGVRCDMAMLPEPDIFEKTHGKKGSPYWSKIIPAIRQKHPDFQWIAEVYWDREYSLQQKGFDYTYDKTLYDRISAKQSQSISDHLQADLAFQEKSLRFIENHDEPRAYQVFGEYSIYAFSLMAFLPGMVLYHQFQNYGYEKKLPVQLARHPEEEVQDSIFSFYIRAFEHIQLRKSHNIHHYEMQLTPYDNGELTDVICQVLVMDNRFELLVYNSYDHEIAGKLEFDHDNLQSLSVDADKPIEFQDVTDTRRYIREYDDIVENGLFIKLRARQAHWFVWENE